MKANISEIIKLCPKLLQQYPIRCLYEKNNFNELSVIKMQHVSLNKVIYYPEFLFSRNVNLENEISTLNKYKSNSGFAIGLSKDEALVHGINELIERDCLSSYFKEVYFQRSEPTRIVDINQLSSKLKMLIDEVEKTIGSEIILIDISKYQGIYCYYAISKNQKNYTPFKGSGASTISDYALERSLLELLQHYQLHDSQDKLVDYNIKNVFKSYHNYYQAIMTNYEDYPIQRVNINRWRMSECESVSKILVTLTEIITSYGLEIYYCQIVNIEGVVGIKVVIPGTDNFQAINNGMLLIPNEVENYDNY